MAIRKKKKAPKRRVAKKPVKRSSPRSSDKKTKMASQKAHSAAYHKLQKQVKTAWASLKKHIQKKAPSHILLRDRNRLLLLLGECNYMTRQCAQLAGSKKGNK